MLCLWLMGLPAIAQDLPDKTSTEPPTASSPALQPDWAHQYLANDALASKTEISLDDIRNAIQDVQLRDHVIERHFRRVTGASETEKRDLLVELLNLQHPVVQRQAAQELFRRNELESVVRDHLLLLLESPDQQTRTIVIAGLEFVATDQAKLPDTYYTALADALSSEQSQLAIAAEHRAVADGATAIPILLELLKSDRPEIRLRAARVLSQIVGTIAPLSEHPPTAKSLPPTAAPPDQEVVRKGRSAPSTHATRQIDESKPTVVRVFFGTNREMIPSDQPPWSRILFYPIIAVCLLLAIGWSGWKNYSGHTLGCTNVGLVLLFLLGAGWTLFIFRDELIDRWKIGTGPKFGGRRDALDLVHYGTCDVSIPASHRIGEIESPTFGPEDESVHVVLQKTEALSEEVYFKSLRERLAEIPEHDRACFVFIHGFNVTFESAAKRTAQIYHDLQFSGAPIFFSWPSRASVRHYFSDRNEIEFSRYVIKQFLLDVAEKVHADKIHVIAHSMGADATCRAIAELGDRGKIFDQIILAAPDIDRDVFRTQIAPRLTQTAKRTTLYCSKNDWALLASKTFNDAIRAGDSSESVLVVKDVDTVDASGIDTDMLGHSYYGDCLPILHDVQQIMNNDLPPTERALEILAGGRADVVLDVDDR